MWALNWFRDNEIITIINDGVVYVESKYSVEYLGPVEPIVEYVQPEETTIEYIDAPEIIVTYLGELKSLVQYIPEQPLNIELQ